MQLQDSKRQIKDNLLVHLSQSNCLARGIYLIFLGDFLFNLKIFLMGIFK
jgi:hypothetical protein